MGDSPSPVRQREPEKAWAATSGELGCGCGMRLRGCLVDDPNVPNQNFGIAKI